MGCYDFLKPDLTALIGFLIKELTNVNKFIRAISCWSISRYYIFLTNKIKSENYNLKQKTFILLIRYNINKHDLNFLHNLHLIKINKNPLSSQLINQTNKLIKKQQKN